MNPDEITVAASKAMVGALVRIIHMVLSGPLTVEEKVNIRNRVSGLEISYQKVMDVTDTVKE